MLCGYGVIAVNVVNCMELVQIMIRNIKKLMDENMQSDFSARIPEDSNLTNI